MSIPTTRDDDTQPLAIVTASASHTRAVASVLGELLTGGEVLGLVGDLGAGKTCFVQGLASGLGVSPDAYVCSPSFALWCQHRGRVPLYHVDLFRLCGPEEAESIGYEDLFDGEAVVAIEWFDRFPELWPEGFLLVELGESSAGEPRSDQGAARPGEGPDAVRGRRLEPARPDEAEWASERSSRTLSIQGVGARHQEVRRRFAQALEARGRSGSSERP